MKRTQQTSMSKKAGRPIEILLVEDSPSDAELTIEALREARVSNQLNANCYIIKPVNFQQFLEVVRTIESFWLTVVTLPRGE